MGRNGTFGQKARKLAFRQKPKAHTRRALFSEQQRICGSEVGRFRVRGKRRRNSALSILGRPYNAYVSEAHMGIPQKFASRGIPVIAGRFPAHWTIRTRAKQMYWSAGQDNPQGGGFHRQAPPAVRLLHQQFFLRPRFLHLGFARDRMGRKPMLVLELDSHVADAGLETRIEAFIDIIRNYLRLQDAGGLPQYVSAAAAQDPLRSGPRCYY